MTMTTAALNDEHEPHRPNLMAQISFELRTVLARILGIAYILNETVLTFEQREYIQIIEDSAHRLLHLEIKLHELLRKKDAGLDH